MDGENNSKTIDNIKNRGFGSHPELINRNGRPKKGTSLTDIMREMLEEEIDGKKRKDVLVRRVLDLAYQGNEAMIKMAWSYLEGMPKQSIDINKDTNSDYEAFLNKCEEDGIDPKTGLPLGVNE